MSTTTPTAPPQTPPAPHLTELRTHLMATLADLRNREQPMDLDRARAVAKVAETLIDTARVEVEFLKLVGQEQSEFFQPPAQAQIGNTPSPSGYTQGIVERRDGVTKHTLRG